MTDISGFGSRVALTASNTYPSGIIISQFADDTDSFDLPSVQIADKAMGVNGDLLTWSKANPLLITLGVIPNGEDDLNLQVLLNANRVAKGKFGAKDQITLTGVLPTGQSFTLSRGTITDGMPAQSLASAGRFKSKTYAFAFEDLTVN